jgi:hypothetical protein
MDNYKYFSQLCESIVSEASTALAQFTGPGAQEILKQLHSKEALGHDVQPEPVARPKWTDLKEKPGAWLLIAGNKGFGAVKFMKGRWRNTGAYQVFASNGRPDPEEGNMIYSTESSNVSEANGFLKKYIGDAKKFYFMDSEYSRNLRLARAGNKPDPVGFMTTTKLVSRFKPLFKKILIASKADINGVIANMAKNDAHHKMDKKIARVHAIDSAIRDLDDGNMHELLTAAVNNSIVLAARYYYPELTGNVTSGYRYRDSNLSADKNDGATKILSDIANGDREKLSAVLAYLKRSLV